MSFLGMDIGWGELLIILIVALLVVGPDKLPAYARKTARFVRKFRSVTTNLTGEISKAMNLDDEEGNPTNFKKDLMEVKKSLEKDVADLKASLDTQAKTVSDTLESGTREANAVLQKNASEISDTLNTQADEIKTALDAQAKVVSDTVEAGMKEATEGLQKSAAEISEAMEEGTTAISPAEEQTSVEPAKEKAPPPPLPAQSTGVPTHKPAKKVVTPDTEAELSEAG